MDISIVIPVRGEHLGLWATVSSIEEEMKYADISYEYVLVSNGEPVSVVLKEFINWLDRTGKLRSHVHREEPLSPPVARATGVEQATGEYLAFFDNHCILGRTYFQRMLQDFREIPEIELLHSSTRFYPGEEIHYGYKLRLDYNFWATSTTHPKDFLKPYRVAAAGHGGFAMRRSTWDEVGGYGPDSLLVGYGGEELLFDLKMWRLGKQVWIDPRLLHWHAVNSRGYTRHYDDAYYINLMVTANVIGGEKYLYQVFDSFTKKNHLRIGAEKADMYDLLQVAISRSAQYAAELDAKSVRSLDQVLVHFRAEGIPY